MSGGTAHIYFFYFLFYFLLPSTKSCACQTVGLARKEYDATPNNLLSSLALPAKPPEILKNLNKRGK